MFSLKVKSHWKTETSVGKVLISFNNVSLNHFIKQWFAHWLAVVVVFLSSIDVSYLWQLLSHVLVLEHQNYYRAVQRALWGAAVLSEWILSSCDGSEGRSDHHWCCTDISSWSGVSLWKLLCFTGRPENNWAVQKWLPSKRKPKNYMGLSCLCLNRLRTKF